MVRRLLLLCCALAFSATTMAQDSSSATEPAPSSESAPQPNAAPPTPPPTQTPPPNTSDVDEPFDAEEEEDEDSWGVMYLRFQGGFSYANLLSFNQDNFIPEAEESSGLGPFGGLSVGFRVYWFSMGVSGSFGRQGGFDLGTVGAELAFHIPIPKVQPYIRLAAGYAWVGRYDFQSRELAETDIYGLTVEAGAGIDIKLARHLSIGAGFDAAFLNLTRQELGSVNITGVDLEESGDALGFQLRAHAHLTIHI
ncbi:MAG: hypothetical protein AB8H86_26485 [Polyangiales bacterium]